jgi:hypothetical protein
MQRANNEYCHGDPPGYLWVGEDFGHDVQDQPEPYDDIECRSYQSSSSEIDRIIERPIIRRPSST